VGVGHESDRGTGSRRRLVPRGVWDLNSWVLVWERGAVRKALQNCMWRIWVRCGGVSGCGRLELGGDLRGMGDGVRKE